MNTNIDKVVTVRRV